MRQLTAAELEVQDLNEYAWPVTMRFRVRLPWGDTTQLLTVDAPNVAGDIDSTLKLSSVLWGLAVAPATSNSALLLYTDVVAWRYAAAALPWGDGFTRGTLAGTPTPRRDTACACFDSGHLDDRAVQRFPLPGIPSRWVSRGLLTLGALDALEAWGGMMLMGLCRQLTGAPMQLLLHYPDLLEHTSANPRGVAFRRVEFVYGMWHTRPAPEPSSAPWP